MSQLERDAGRSDEGGSSSGNELPQVSRAGRHFRLQDVVEIAMGACIMAFPVSAAEELWDLGAELAPLRVFCFAIASIFFLAVVIYVLHGHRLGPENRNAFVLRVISTYGVTLLICALLLLGLDKLPILEDPMVALNRSILAAFPASFAATAVDNLANPEG